MAPKNANKKNVLSQPVKLNSVKRQLRKLNAKVKKSVVDEISNVVCENSKRLREKKKNELYIKLKGYSGEESLMAEHVKGLHPGIIDVRLPRKPKRMKFAWAVFNSEEEAMKALATLKKNTLGYYVDKGSRDPKISKITTKYVKDKTKMQKRALIKLWNAPD